MDWLEEEVGEYEDDYLIIDCPGMSGLLVFPRSPMRHAMLQRAWTTGGPG